MSWPVLLQSRAYITYLVQIFPVWPIAGFHASHTHRCPQVASGGVRDPFIYPSLKSEKRSIKKKIALDSVCASINCPCRSHAFDLPTIARTTLVLPIFTPCLKKRNTLTAATASEKIREEIALKVIYSHVRMHKQGVEIIFNKIQTTIRNTSLGEGACVPRSQICQDWSRNCGGGDVQPILRARGTGMSRTPCHCNGLTHRVFYLDATKLEQSSCFCRH